MLGRPSPSRCLAGTAASASRLCCTSKTADVTPHVMDRLTVHPLHSVMRQQDADFINLLQEVRRGYISPQSLATLQAASRRRSLQTNPTILFPTRAQVKAENARQFDALPGITHTYIAYDQSGVNLDTGERYLEDHERRTCFLNTASPSSVRVNPSDCTDTQHLLTESEIKLKIGTRVLLLRVSMAAVRSTDAADCIPTEPQSLRPCQWRSWLRDELCAS